MSERIKLVQGDTRPQIKVVLLDEETGVPLSLVGATAVLKFRALGADTLQASVPGILATGFENADGTINTAAPYNVAGAGGRVIFIWAEGDLDCEPGDYEGEIEVTFSDGTVQTVYGLLKFRVREDF